MHRGSERTLLPSPKKITQEDINAMSEENRNKYYDSLWNRPKKAGIWGNTEQDMIDNFKMVKPSEYDQFRRLRRAGLEAVLSQDAAKAKAPCGLARSACGFFLEDRPGDRAMRGSLGVMRRDHETAIAESNAALRQDPTLLRAWRSRARARLERFDYEGAARDAVKALELCHGQSLVSDFEVLGLAKKGMQDYKGAIAAFTKAIEQDDRRWQLYWNRGDVKLQQLNWQGAVDDCNEALRWRVGEADEIHVTLASAYLQLQDYHHAEVDLTIALRSDCGRADFWFKLAEVRGKLENWEDARKDINKAIKLDSANVEYWRFSATLSLREKDWEKVIYDCESIMGLDPSVAEAWSQRGEARIALGHYEEGIADLDEAALLDPSTPLPAYYAAKSKFQKGLYLAAIADCHRALSADPSYKPAQQLLKKAEDADRSLTSWKIPGTQLVYTPRRKGQEDFLLPRADVTILPEALEDAETLAKTLQESPAPLPPPGRSHIPREEQLARQKVGNTFFAAALAMK